jgi:hypothetical protein
MVAIEPRLVKILSQAASLILRTVQGLEKAGAAYFHELLFVVALL